ncbi:MAG: hypothetical protein OEV40_16810 [Acidimicrobiia bacterium]|nr:hypothetical protein [Acidimicrobiia bacterium]
MYWQLGRPFACINAATLWALAGESARSAEMAAAALVAPGGVDDEVGGYWTEATAAEASILLGDLDAAQAHLVNASLLNVGDLGARASTLRQLHELCSHLRIDRQLLEPLRNPSVLHFCGHRIVGPAGGGGFPTDKAKLVGRRIDEALDGERYGAAYGSLACGADILFAERLVERGIDLHVVLPFGHEQFIRVSVASGGVGWADRFRRCLRAAKSVTIASDSGYQGDDVLFGYASSIAMGSALNRARSWATHATQLAVWDGLESNGVAGTAHDVRRWKQAGGSTTVIDVETIVNRAKARQPNLGRIIHPILFGDVNGFSRLHDDRMGPFLDNVLAPVGDYLRSIGDVVLHRATWGDGIKLILSDVAAAAGAAIAIQEILESVNMEDAGLPSDMGLRMSGHVGPVVEVVDPIVGERSFTGRELTRAARIEPRTPVGQVYVTHAFASLLALEPLAPAVPEYVGTITTAKDFETVPMYVLSPRHPTHSRPTTGRDVGPWS